MKRTELEQLAAELHRKANASTGIPAAEDKNEWIADRLDEWLREDTYELADMLEECDTPEQVIQRVREIYRQLNHVDSHGFNE